LPKERKKEKIRAEQTLVLDEKRRYYAEVLAEIVGKMYGETARKVIKHIVESGGSAPEETIGKDSNVKSNEARKILQKLSNEALVTCRGRRVDDKVLHFWILNWDQVESFLVNRLKKTREKLETLLKFIEGNIIYVCPICGREFTLDQALDNEFKCPQDDEPLIEVDKQDVIKFLKEKIKEIDDELAKIGA